MTAVYLQFENIVFMVGLFQQQIRFSHIAESTCLFVTLIKNAAASSEFHCLAHSSSRLGPKLEIEDNKRKTPYNVDSSVRNFMRGASRGHNLDIPQCCWTRFAHEFCLAIVLLPKSISDIQTGT